MKSYIIAIAATGVVLSPLIILCIRAFLYICLFADVVVEHSLEPDGTISMSLAMYEVEQSADSPLGVHQKRVLKSGLAMGSESGEQEADSVMLGEEHELVFKTKRLA